MSKAISIGSVEVSGRVWVAPMTGISDLPFRLIAARMAAAYVATEMVAGDALVQARPEAVRRAAVGEGIPLMVVQLVGADPVALAKSAAIATLAGARIIDLNLGCPAKSVTGIACGSALMRDPAAAQALIAAVVRATDRPVTVKMRLGWDDRSRNAAELAARAEAVGAAGVTVHARTRQQFYTGRADWRAVAAVKTAVSIPVIVNGDIADAADARQALRQSGADGVMIGRGVLGRPWIPAAIEASLSGARAGEPDAMSRLAIVLDHLNASVAFYGATRGVRMFRKHLAAYIEHAPWPDGQDARRRARAAICQLERRDDIAEAVAALWRPEARNEARKMAA